MATPEQVHSWCESTRPRDWYGQCAGLTWNAIDSCGGYAPDVYPSARAAYLDSPIASLDAAAAPPGAIHYWDYTDSSGNRYGHVTLDIYGGGSDTLAASHKAHEYWGVSAGLISVAQQTVSYMPYLGWSYTYGSRNRITIDTAPDLTDQEAWMLQALYNQLLVFASDGSIQYSWAQALLNAQRTELMPALHSIPTSVELDYRELAHHLAQQGITVGRTHD